MKKLIIAIIAITAITSASAEIHKKPAVIDYGDKAAYIEYQTWESLYPQDNGTDYPSEYRVVTSRDEAGRVLTLNK